MGFDLVEEAIREAVQFRKRIVTLGRELAKSPEGEAPWFFGVWQPEEVRDPASDAVLAFVDAPNDLLETEPSCWSLEPPRVMARLRRASTPATACSIPPRSP